MSLGKQKNLVVLGAVVAALLVGGVLVADYADVLPGWAKTDGPIKACQSGEAKPSCAAKAETAGFPQVVAATTQPAGPAESCCGEPCPPDCPKPRCEKKPGCCENPPAGCCEERQQSEAAGSCCAAKADAATE